MIEAGEALLRHLDTTELQIEAACWIYLPESNVWRLIHASPQVKEQGLRAVYKRIREAHVALPSGQAQVPLRDISVVAPSQELVTLLREAIG